MLNKIKNLGQVYTPSTIVNDMLDWVGYSGDDILQKHIIDNSCGNGAFLCCVVDRYIKAYKDKHDDIEQLKTQLSQYVHGIEIDKTEYKKCIDNLDSTAFLHGLTGIQWDIVLGDALVTNQFDGKMDFVVGNPPYVRVHNLASNFAKVREFAFAKSGMTDLYIVFYELSFGMLAQNGKLVYITPNSFYSSVAGGAFRDYIRDTKLLKQIVDLGHYQPFGVTTYTTICIFDKGRKFDKFDYYTYNNNILQHQEQLAYEDAFSKGKIVLAKKQNQDKLKLIQNYQSKIKILVKVKNAYATLADSVFIKDKFDCAMQNTIPIIKASTSQHKQCIYPYDKDAKLIPFCNLDAPTQKHLNANKTTLQTRSLDKKTQWYAFGRSQAIVDTYKDKITINTTIKDVNTIKLNLAAAGSGVYSGLYILTDVAFEKIKNIVKTQDFVDYVATIGKCKSGGYYTFSSSDLQQYLIYKLENTNEQ